MTFFLSSNKTSIDHHSFGVAPYSSIASSDLIPLEVRKYIRERHKPAYLNDYDCPVKSYSSLHTFPSVIGYHNLPQEHRSFVLQVGLIQEPKCYVEVARIAKWSEAMKLELEAIEAKTHLDCYSLAIP